MTDSNKALSVRNWNMHFENAESRKVRVCSFVCLPNKHDGKGYARIATCAKSCRAFTGWMLILQVASKMPQRGLLVDEDGALDVDDLAAMTRFESSVFDDAIEVLTQPKIGWLEWVDVPEELELSGRKQDKIPIRRDVPGRAGICRDAPGRREGKGTEGKGTEFTNNNNARGGQSIEGQPCIDGYPSKGQAVAAGGNMGVPEEVSERWWLDRDGEGWQSRNGHPMRPEGWHSNLKSYWEKWKANEQRQKTNGNSKFNSKPSNVRSGFGSELDDD